MATAPTESIAATTTTTVLGLVFPVLGGGGGGEGGDLFGVVGGGGGGGRRKFGGLEGEGCVDGVSPLRGGGVHASGGVAVVVVGGRRCSGGDWDSKMVQRRVRRRARKNWFAIPELWVSLSRRGLYRWMTER